MTPKRQEFAATHLLQLYSAHFWRNFRLFKTVYCQSIRYNILAKTKSVSNYILLKMSFIICLSGMFLLYLVPTFWCRSRSVALKYGLNNCMYSMCMQGSWSAVNLVVFKYLTHNYTLSNHAAFDLTQTGVTVLFNASCSVENSSVEV